MIGAICVRCGKRLIDVRTIACAIGNEPAHCEDCRKEVLAEAAKGYGMWPSEWAGRSCLDKLGNWYYTDAYNKTIMHSVRVNRYVRLAVKNNP